MIKTLETYTYIFGYEKSYQVSNFGNVKSLNYLRTGQKQILKLDKCKRDGHLRVWLCKNGYRKRFLVHRLVLEAFVGPCPSGMECRHLDGNPENNKLENLKWGTRSENRIDSISHGTAIWIGSRNNKSKLNEQQVRIIKYLLKEKNLTHREIAIIFGVSKQTIDLINVNKIWRHILIN